MCTSQKCVYWDMSKGEHLHESHLPAAKKDASIYFLSIPTGLLLVDVKKNLVSVFEFENGSAQNVNIGEFFSRSHKSSKQYAGEM